MLPLCRVTTSLSYQVHIYPQPSWDRLGRRIGRSTAEEESRNESPNNPRTTTKTTNKAKHNCLKSTPTLQTLFVLPRPHTRDLNPPSSLYSQTKGLPPPPPDESGSWTLSPEKPALHVPERRWGQPGTNGAFTRRLRLPQHHPSLPTPPPSDGVWDLIVLPLRLPPPASLWSMSPCAPCENLPHVPAEGIPV